MPRVLIRQDSRRPVAETSVEREHRSDEVPAPTTETIQRRAAIAARAADAKLGVDTVILEVGPVLSITDAFVITSGANARQVRSIAEEVEHQLRVQEGVKPHRSEGLKESTWILLDYGDFVVHVFLDETRRFYDLERLWSDVAHLPWELAATPGTRSA
jgi:ribosome-associated protein